MENFWSNLQECKIKQSSHMYDIIFFIAILKIKRLFVGPVYHGLYVLRN